MPIIISSRPGKVFQKGEKISIAKLNQLGLPVLALSGTLGPSEMATGDYSAIFAAGAYFYGVDTGTAGAAAVTLSPSVNVYVDGMLVAVKLAFPNTGAATLNLNGIGARAVKKYVNSDLDANDWLPGQIACFRYQLDANLVPALGAYSSGGVYTVPVTAGRTYTWTKGANDTSCVNGTTTLVATGTFVAAGTTATLNGTLNTLVTATVIANSNVWQMLSMLGNAPQRYFDLVGASALTRGIPGLAPAAKPGQQTFGLRGDGTWFDFLTAAAALANPGGAAIEVFKQQNFI